MQIKPFAIMVSTVMLGLIVSQFNGHSTPQFKDSIKQAGPIEATMNKQRIVVGAGCFWGVEKRFEALPGVIDAVSGYADGKGFSATYKNIVKRKNRFNTDNYAEVVEVSYNSDQISLDTLLQHYYEMHDPTQGNRQGNDVGTNYRSTILYSTAEEKNIATQVTNAYQALLTKAGYGKITTKIKKLDKFVPAEDYHQDYLAKNPNGYCPDHSTGVRFNTIDTSSEKVNNVDLLSGKHIVVIDSRTYCPYCEKLKKEVTNDYQGTVPLHYRYADQLNGLQVKSPTWATPTILFLENGKETFGYQGYLSAKQFYKALGFFKLGNSEAFKVAFQEGTDARFCKQYQIFKNTPSGQFIDKLSGAPLFDTNDRFNSGTGWLSFRKPVDGAVYEKQDLSYGMVRTEIRSTSSDIHLGHVFYDQPGGGARYCINATVLEFKPRTAIN